MKIIGFLFLVLIIATPSFGLIESFGEEYDRVIATLQSTEETDAMDAFWQSKELLQVGVFKHEKDYNEYAQHVCKTIINIEMPSKNITINIVDLKQLVQTQKLIVVGTTQCVPAQ